MKLAQVWQEVYPTASRPDSINPPATFADYDERLAAYQALRASDADAQLYDVAKELFESDRDRRASIFARAQGLMPAIGIAVALVSSIGYGVLLKRADLEMIPRPAQFGMIVCYLCTVGFLVRSAVLVLKVQGSQRISVLGPEDVMPTEEMTLPAYKRGVTLKRLAYVIANWKATNSRVDLLYTAQKNIRNATIAIALGGVVPVVVWFLSALHRAAPSLGNPY
jgi:hypothetical protein